MFVGLKLNLNVYLQLKEAIFSGKVAKCKESVEGEICDGVIKPDIVMFGEALPQVRLSNHWYLVSIFRSALWCHFNFSKF